MTYYTYVLRSGQNGDIYIGSSANVSGRLKLHNEGKAKSTKGYRPWELLEKEEFKTRSEAMRKEYFLKSHQQKELLKKKYGLVVK